MRALSDHLIAPTWSAWADRHQLIMSPGGALSYLPFDLLYGPDGRQLSFSHVISYVPSATTLLRLNRLQARSVSHDLDFAGFAADAGPDSSSSDVGIYEPLSPLPAAVREVIDIQRLFPGRSLTFVGPAATRRSVEVVAGSTAFFTSPRTRSSKTRSLATQD